MGYCIYCQNDSSSSVSTPHIVPEAFISNDTTLAVGVECDECNSYASQLENAFIHHNRIWIPIMAMQVPGKSGKIREKLGFYRKGKEKGKIIFTFRKEWINDDDNGRHIQSPNPSEFDELKFRRCLGHITLNYIAWKLGWAVALEPRFDRLRRFVRYGNRYSMWPYGQVSFEDIKFRKKLSLGLVDCSPGLFVRLESYIDDFYVDPLNEGGLEDWVTMQEGKECLYFS